MNRQAFLTEQIATGSRRLGIFLKGRVATLRQIETTTREAIAAIEKNERDGDYLVRYAIGHLRDGDRPMMPSPYSVNLNRAYDLDRVIHSAESVLKFGTATFMTYLVSALSDLSPIDRETRAFLALVPRAEEGLRAYGFEPGAEQTETDEEYRAAKNCLDALEVIRRNLNLLDRIIPEMQKVCADMERRQAYSIDPHKYRPEHEKIESLFHASLYAAQIVRDGFRAERPESAVGVGNIGTDQSLISFTYDIKVAHDILRAFRDIWLIVHGKLTRKDIVGWLRDEHIDLRQAEGYFMNAREPKDSIPQVIRLYRAYLGLSTLRSDPVIVSPEKLATVMETIRYDDMGIVRCDVRLNEDEEFLHGEAEFRVPPSQIVGPITRVL